MKSRSLLLMLMLYSSLLSADVNEIWNSTKIAGFVSQGYTRTSDNNFYGNSEKKSGSVSLRELGLNVSSNLSPSIFSSAQILARNTEQNEDDGITLDYALIDYSRPISSEQTYGIRIGRIKNPTGFYNETRDVPFTRSGVLLPQSIYFDRTRDLSLSGDGFHLYGESHQTDYTAEFTIGVGKPRTDKKSITTSLLGPSAMGTLDSEVGYLWNILIHKNAYTLAYSGAFLQLNYRDSASLNRNDGNVKFLLNVFSFQYDAEYWAVTAEYADRRFDFTNLGAFLPFQEINGESYYLQLTSIITPSLNFFLRYDVLYQNRKDRDGVKIASLTGGATPAHTQFAKDWTVGLRWDINQLWMLRLEHHWINGTAWLPRQNNPDAATTKKDWRMLAGIVSFRF
ncbi:hypothetical protein MNBD_GAMMA16-1924 [hydrothermal vent metagenome]|uniref:Porin n=1 Tax=hydrothermal vent metagenome TaxID=652676 RepID=A0A3B0YTW6_9ZZZZ